MADDGKREKSSAERFAPPPHLPDVPEAPKIDVKLPSRESGPKQGTVAPGGYQKLAVAATAASSFIAPIIVLGAGGWWLDQRFHGSNGLFAFAGTVLGFIAGIVSLLRVIKQLNR